MRNRKESHGPIRQNGQTVKKSQKHEANLQKNSTLYFQVGLIVCLLLAHTMFEMKFQTKTLAVADPLPLDPPFTIDVPLIKPEVKPMEEPVEQKKVTNPTILVPVDNDTPIKPPIVDEPVDTDTPPIDPDDIVVVAAPVDTPPVDFIRVEQVPLFPGCEKKKDREAQSKCMSDKINKLIQRKFNVDLADQLGLSGVQKIDVQFKIDKTGKVTDIKTRAPHPLLEKEAKRVIDLIPDMTPGKQRDQPVEVRFTQPIRFQVYN